MPAHEFDGGQGFVAKPPRHPPHASGLGAAAAPPRTLAFAMAKAETPAVRPSVCQLLTPPPPSGGGGGPVAIPRIRTASGCISVHGSTSSYTHALHVPLARRSRYALPRATLGRTARGACFAARRTRCALPSPPTRRPAPHCLRLPTFRPSRCQREGVCRARRSAPLPTRSRSRLRRRRRASARQPNHARPAGLMFPPTRPGSRGSREVSSSRRPSGAAASRPCAE